MIKTYIERRIIKEGGRNAYYRWIESDKSEMLNQQHVNPYSPMTENDEFETWKNGWDTATTTEPWVNYPKPK